MGKGSINRLAAVGVAGPLVDHTAVDHATEVVVLEIEHSPEEARRPAQLTAMKVALAEKEGELVVLTIEPERRLESIDRVRNLVVEQ